MITTFYGNLLDSKAKFICHQVNCRGKMGAGIALQIRNKFPTVYSAYTAMCELNSADKLLGKIQIVSVGYDKNIVNMFAQDGYGYDRQYTDIEAFKKCLEHLRDQTTETDIIAFPYGIGCGHGGANWTTVYMNIKNILNDRNVYLYKLK